MINDQIFYQRLEMRKQLFDNLYKIYGKIQVV